MNEGCIFCKIVSGEISSATIYEDNEFKVILDRFPASIGHALIIPKVHIESIFEMNSEIASKLFVLAVKISNDLKAKLNLKAMNVLQNNGKLAGQTVNHFHMHLIPRYENDEIVIGWKNLSLSDATIKKLI